MAETAVPNPHIERILAAKTPVVLLRGPVATGKTAAVRGFLAHLARGGQRCLLLVPNAPAAAAMRSALLADSPTGVLVAPRVMTFAGLVARILADDPAGGALLSPLRRHLLLRHIIDELNAAGKLVALAAVADTPGLVGALDRAIAELKRAAVEPDALARAVGSARDRRADLVTIYRRYQEHLHAAKTYDLEGLTWLARDRLESWTGPDLPPGLGDVHAVAADGFTDFTPTELDLLTRLSRLLPRVVITLPLTDDGRGRLWHWTARTVERIRGAFAGRCSEIALSPDPAARPPLAALWDRLFDFDASPCELPGGLSVIAAAGTEAEVATVARRVKRLLVDGAPAGSIAVLARSMEVYRETLERVFAAYRIPLRPGGRPLPAEPLVRFALNVTALAPRFAYHDVLGVVRSSYFRPQALGAFDATTVAAAEAVVRYGNVIAEREAYTRAAHRLAAKLAHRDQATEDADERLPRFSPEQLLQAEEMLQALFTLADEACKPGGLGLVIERLDLTAAACDHDDAGLIARDLRALAALQGALDELPSPAPPPATLEHLLGAVTCPPPGGASAVDVLDVLDARAMRYRHVFLLGLTEGQFPRRFADSALLTEADRRDFSAAGLAVDTRGDLTTREMLLAYLAMSRAARSLTLSYQETDAAGRPAAPSSFLTALLEPAGGLDAAEAAGIVEHVRPGRFLPAPEQLASVDEAATAAVVGLFDRQTDPRGAALAFSTAHAPQRLAAAAAGLLARDRRWTPGPPDRYDGRLTDAALRARLAERFGDQAVFSASQLNAYGTCPWQFLASYVLDLQPLPAPAERLTPLDRGLFCHRVLFGVLARLAEELGAGFRLADLDEARVRDVLDQTVADASAALETRQDAYPTLLAVQRRQMRDQMADYLAAQRDTTGQLDAECLHFELAFGLAPPPAGTDPTSTPEPVAIQTPAGPIRLRGKIDRLDRIRFADATGLLVVDYKTGHLPTPADIDAGRALQVALYSAAAGTLLGEASLGGAYHQIGGDGKQSALAVFKPRGGRFVTDKKYDARREAAMEHVGRFVASIRRGRFDALPPHDCPRYCPYRRICQFSEPRAALKATDEEDAS